MPICPRCKKKHDSLWSSKAETRTVTINLDSNARGICYKCIMDKLKNREKEKPCESRK